MVEFTQTGEAVRWRDGNVLGKSLGDGSLVSNYTSLLVTPNHDMYARDCTLAASGSLEKRWGRGADMELSPFFKRTAEALLAPDAADAVAFLGHAPGGLGMPIAPAAAAELQHNPAVKRAYWDSYAGQRRLATDAETAAAASIAQAEADVPLPDFPFVTMLGLHTADKFAAFLEMYGYWLGDGTLNFNPDGSDSYVHFYFHKPHDATWLRARFDILGLPWICKVRSVFRCCLVFILTRIRCFPSLGLPTSSRHNLTQLTFPLCRCARNASGPPHLAVPALAVPRLAFPLRAVPALAAPALAAPALAVPAQAVPA